VKAYRKLAREGFLPPVLTWWVTGLQALVVVDGRARLAAAWAQGVPAPVLTLVEVNPAHVDDGVQRWVSSYEATTFGIRNLPGERADRAHAYLSRRLADALESIRTRGITRAWPLPGGTAQWQAIADAHGWGQSSG
jgi:hypothetical protein